MVVNLIIVHTIPVDTIFGQAGKIMVAVLGIVYKA